ncbi:hypothetical protein AADEFJLK_04660 [Methylovulum psychrotolerans]|uniref:Uncharacterized protein n=1 Tax=Methylovulum psychrotolerans TaxID=1704499 RepID=A0A2S5CFI8_9GAMM|nr:hypothetical protein AADEFJLK_04660 [Methylovulum psychrotolerans]
MEQPTEQVNEKAVQFMLLSVVNLPIIYPQKICRTNRPVHRYGGWPISANLTMKPNLTHH